jgi:spermidine/putrescine-binding protein
MDHNKSIGLSRRGMLQAGLMGAAGLAVSPLLSACGGRGAGGSANGLSVLSYGGPIQELQSKLLVPTMLKQHDVSATVTSTGTVMAPQVAAQLPDPDYDLFTENFLLYPTTQDAWTKIDQTKVPNSRNVYPVLLDYFEGRGIPAWIHSQTIVYNADHFDAPPTLEELTKPKYKGKISLQATPATMYIAPTLMAWTGATLENEAPMWDWVERVAPNIATNYSQPTQPVQMFQSGEVWAAMWYTGRAAELAATTDVPVKWVSENATGVVIGMAVPPNTENVDGAYAYINEWLEPTVQGKMAETAFFGPVTSNAQISSEMEERVPVYGQDEIDQLILPDWGEISPRLKEWQSRFDSIMASR